MSVNSIYLAVRWQPFLETAQRLDAEERLAAAQEKGESWIRSFPFGNQVDEYLFESRKALWEFDEWFREARTPRSSASGQMVSSGDPVGLDTDLISLAIMRLRRLISEHDRLRRLFSGKVRAIEAFCALFRDFGLINEDGTLKLKPINTLSRSTGEWLVAAMSPEDVRLLRNRATAVNRGELEVWFDAALELKPCRLVEDGKAAVAWLDALTFGLNDTASKKEGVVLGIA